MAICNHQADSPLVVWPDALSGDFQALNALTETRCH